MTKYALLVGIANYLNPKWQLFGPLNDVANMRRLLTEKYLFAGTNIVELVDEKATKANILTELENLLKRAYNVGGDVHVVFFYSGHGTQVPDISGDEPDKLDEALVPYDFDIENSTTAILDDEVMTLFTQYYRKKMIVDVIYDACFSGGMERGFPVNRTIPVNPKYAHLPKKVKERPPVPIAIWTASRENQMSYEWWFNCDPSTPKDKLCCDLSPECLEGAFTHFLTETLSDHPDISRSSAMTIVRKFLKDEDFPQNPRLIAPSTLKRRSMPYEGGDPEWHFSPNP